MKSKVPKDKSLKPKKLSKRSAVSKEAGSTSNKLTLFDHVKHIRGVQSPDYYVTLSEENRKSFNHFMILRALSMDNEIVQSMAFLYRYFDKIPSPQFYQLLIALVPRGFHWIPWIKTKVVKHSPDLLSLVAENYQVSKRQANEYVNVLIASEVGLENLASLCQSKGFNDAEVEALFGEK